MGLCYEVIFAPGVIEGDNIFALLIVFDFDFTLYLERHLSRVIRKSSYGMLFRNSYFII